jgi:glycosyltransferase involved in cell wall biosynthesis
MAAFFCNDYDSNGIPVGYCADYFDTTFEHISCFITDHASFLRDLFDKKNLAASFDERVQILYQPAVPAKAKATARTRVKSRKVLWIGRHSPQKRPELASQIATLAPNWQFDFFGPEFPWDFRLPANATVKGAVASFSEIPVEEYKCLLHTAAWDGLPNVLLEASHSGLPIVAPAVGGIPELVNDKTGWLVRERDDPRAYHQALEALDSNNAEASRRVAAMRALVGRRHSTRAFDSRICTIFGG